VDFELGADALALRHELRALLKETLPDSWHGGFDRDPEVQKTVAQVCQRLADRGLLTASWPVEYGGSERDAWQQTVLREEMWSHLEPRGAHYMGLNWVGPTIMEFGTAAQRQTHLSAISNGEAVWCQGFSEPDTGSDLASLRLSAQPSGDGWTLNGQKIWTSYAGLANWCFLAARTSNEATKHSGITIFLLPLDTPGITCVPIESMLGEEHLNEVYFDDVAVGPEDVLGVVGSGWDVIRYVLMVERIGIARYARDERVLAELSTADPGIEGSEAFARAAVHCRIARLLNYRAVALQESSRLSDLEASVARLASIVLDQEVAELALDLMGPSALHRGESGFLAQLSWIFQYARSATIASGTIEIQRMIVARAMLAGGISES